MTSPVNDDQIDQENSPTNSDQRLRGTKSVARTKGINDKLWKMLHWKGFTIIVGSLVALSDIYISMSQGIGTAISVLAAEGAMTLALVTYLQMKSGQQRLPP